MFWSSGMVDLLGGPGKISLAMLVVFVSAKLMAEIFERLGQSGLAGEILAGVLIGPSVLGWIAPDEFLAHAEKAGPLAEFNCADHWVEHPARAGVALSVGEWALSQSAIQQSVRLDAILRLPAKKS